MILRRILVVYAAIAVANFHRFTAYRLWFWVTLLGQILTVTLFVAFWQAVYQGRSTIAGLHAHQTITYIILTQMLLPIAVWGGVTLQLGWHIREGSIASELVKPVDLQGGFYVQGLTSAAISILQQVVPVGLLAAVVFGFRLPLDPAVWAVFALSFLLGLTIAFFVDWIVGCFAFFTTEVWGLGILRNGIALFFGGSLIPLVMLPTGLRNLAYALPFGQTVYQPISLLSGIAPLSSAPHIILVQLAWLVVMLAAARLAFRLSVRHVSVQGG